MRAALSWHCKIEIKVVEWAWPVDQVRVGHVERVLGSGFELDWSSWAMNFTIQSVFLSGIS